MLGGFVVPIVTLMHLRQSSHLRCHLERRPFLSLLPWRPLRPSLPGSSPT